MKKKSLGMLLVFTILSLVLAMTACKGVITLTDLDVPTGLTVTDGVLHWNSVNGANAYIVNCNGVDIATVSDVRYTPTGLKSGTAYIYKVKAKHTLGAYNDSQYSEAYTYEYVANEPVDDNPANPNEPAKPDESGTTTEPTKPTEPTNNASPLMSPANIAINDGIISWSAVENAQSYVVSINGTEYAAAKNELNISSLKDGVYNIKIKAIGDGENYSSSEYCDEMAVDLYDGSVCTTEQFGNFKDINQFESFLGYGFDVVADSIVSDRTVLTSFPIFNVDELLKMRFLKVNSKSSQVKIISEQSMEKFAEQWNSALNVNVSTSVSYAKKINVGGSVKLKNEYSVVSESAKSAYYYCITITDQKFYIVMQGDMDTYRNMLSSGFEKDLYDRNIDPAILFQRYGTHFITSAVMGGRMNAFYNMYSLEEQVSEKNYSEVSTAISTSFKGLFSTKIEASTDISFNSTIETAKSNNHINTKESVDVMGGADFGIATITQVPNVYKDWQQSLDAYPSLMGIKDSSSLIGIWELIDISRDTDNDWTWIDENGQEQHGTRAQQLQAYFYKYGLENYNLLMSASSLPEAVRPEAISDNVYVGGQPADSTNKYFTVGTDSINKISFSVLPDNAVGYTKTYSLDEESQKYAYMDNDELIIRPAALIPSGTILYLTVGAGDVQKTLRIKVIKKYNIDYNLNFQTDYAVDSALGVLEGTAISSPVLMTKTVDGRLTETKIERFGYRLTGWASFENGEYVIYDFSKPVASNLNLFAQWQKITNIVTFDAQGGSFENGQTASSVVVDYYEYAEQPEQDPEKTYYKFDGWVTQKGGDIPFDFENTPIAKKTTVYAKWIPIQYVVTVNYNNGAVSDKVNTSIEDGFIITVTDPTKTYYDFIAWTLADGTEIDLETYLFKQNTTIKAKYAPTVFTITFNTDGGTEIEKQFTSVETDFLMTNEIVTPEKIGYTFTAWKVPTENSYEEMADLTNLTVKSNITVTALYEINQYTVTFDANGGNSISPYANVPHGRTITAPTSPERAGYTFAGWYKDSALEKRFLFEVDTITSDTVLFADWTKETILINVIFVTGIPDRAFDPIIVAKGSLLSSRYTEDMNNEREGYRFDGWFADDKFENYFNPETPITQDVILYAKWVALQYKIEFLDSEEVLESKIYSYGEEIFTPEDPQKEGHTFIGWSAEIPQTMPATDTEIYADFAVNSYTVTYYLTAAGELYLQKSFNFGEEITLAPENPTKIGHEFSGWDTVLPETMPAYDINVTAQWTKAKFIITFYSTNSTDVYTEKHAELEVEYGTKLDSLDLDSLGVGNPTAPIGQKFVRWNFGDYTEMPAENIDAVPVWDLISVNLILNYGNEAADFVAYYGEAIKTYTDKVKDKMTLQNDDFIFDGAWIDEATNSPILDDATVNTTEDEDIVLTARKSAKYAVYTPKDFTITDPGLSQIVNGSIYVQLSDLANFNDTVLSKMCGTATLKVTFDTNQDVQFDLISGGKNLLSKKSGSSKGDKTLSYSVDFLYQYLQSGLQLRFAETCILTSFDIIIKNIKVEVTVNDNYGVEMSISGSNNTPSYKLYTFDSLDEVDTINYVQPTKTNSSRTFETSPVTITGDVYYKFNGWKVNDTDVKLVGNMLQLKSYFVNTRHIAVSGSFSESGTGNYKATAFQITKSPDNGSSFTSNKTAQDVYACFSLSDIKKTLSNYGLSMTVTQINLSVYMEETSDGYQELYLTTAKRNGWASNDSHSQHRFPDNSLVWSNIHIETVSGKKGNDWYSDKFYPNRNIPDIFYLYFGSHRHHTTSEKATYTTSQISLTFYFQ